MPGVKPTIDVMNANHAAGHRMPACDRSYLTPADMAEVLGCCQRTAIKILQGGTIAGTWRLPFGRRDWRVSIDGFRDYCNQSGGELADRLERLLESQ